MVSCRGDYTGEEINFIHSFSPLWSGLTVFSNIMSTIPICCRGDYTGEDELYTRSPLSEPELKLIAYPENQIRVGEITQERSIKLKLSFSPLWTKKVVF